MALASFRRGGWQRDLARDIWHLLLVIASFPGFICEHRALLWLFDDSSSGQLYYHGSVYIIVTF
jgi:hypothetical protein